MKQNYIILALVAAAGVVIYVITKKVKKIDLTQQIKKGLKAVYDKDKLAAKRIEQIYRLETAHFKSEQFKKTGTAGMTAPILDPSIFWGWKSLSNFINDKKLNPSDFVIGYSKKIGGKMFNYIRFKKPFFAPLFMYYYFKMYDYDYGRWFSKNDTEKKKYMLNIEKVTPKFYNEFVENDSA